MVQYLASHTFHHAGPVRDSAPVRNSTAAKVFIQLFTSILKTLLTSNQFYHSKYWCLRHFLKVQEAVHTTSFGPYGIRSTQYEWWSIDLLKSETPLIKAASIGPLTYV